jgi:hypothetical protein
MLAPGDDDHDEPVSMFTIVEAKFLGPNVKQFEIEAPRVAREAGTPPRRRFRSPARVSPCRYGPPWSPRETSASRE